MKHKVLYDKEYKEEEKIKIIVVEAPLYGTVSATRLGLLRLEWSGNIWNAYTEWEKNYKASKFNMRSKSWYELKLFKEGKLIWVA